MMRERDVVVLSTDLPAYGLSRGDVGTIVLVHGERGYEVEFELLNRDSPRYDRVRSSAVSNC